MWGKGKIAAALAATAAVASGAWLTASDNAAAALPDVYEPSWHNNMPPKWQSDSHDYDVHAYGRKTIEQYSPEKDFAQASAVFEYQKEEHPRRFNLSNR